MKWVQFLMAVVFGVMSFTTVGYAEEIRTGEVIEVGKNALTFEDFDTGKSVKLRLDDKTKIKGMLRKGALVELKEKKGRVVSINVIVEEEEEEEELAEDKPEAEEKTEQRD